MYNIFNSARNPQDTLNTFVPSPVLKKQVHHLSPDHSVLTTLDYINMAHMS